MHTWTITKQLGSLSPWPMPRFSWYGLSFSAESYWKAHVLAVSVFPASRWITIASNGELEENQSSLGSRMEKKSFSFPSWDILTRVSVTDFCCSFFPASAANLPCVFSPKGWSELFILTLFLVENVGKVLLFGFPNFLQRKFCRIVLEAYLNPSLC